MADEEKPYQIGDGAREEAARGIAFLDAIKAAQPAKITNGEREAERVELTRLRSDVDLLKKAALGQLKLLGEMRAEIKELRGTVAAIQAHQRRPASPSTRPQQFRPAQPTRKRDGLDDALERELYD